MKGARFFQLVFSICLVSFLAMVFCTDYERKPDAPAINYEAILARKSDSLERVVQQLQDCRKDREKQDTIIMDQRSQIEQFEGLKKSRPPNR